MYFKVPIINGLLDIDYSFLIEGKTISQTEAVVKLQDNAPRRSSWVELTEGEWLASFGGAYLTSDKETITADGVDTATITAKVHPDLTEITFYHADTNEAIATVPVDPATHTATLQVTATTPGAIRIRAGEPTITRLNEVVITAQ